MKRSYPRGLAALSLLLALAACGDQRKATSGEPASEVDHGDGDHDEHGAAGLVRLTPAQITTAKIAIVAAEARTVTTELISNGEVVPPDDGVARIGAKVAGRVARFAVGVGDPVRRGQTVALLDSPELGRAKADYIAAVAAMTVTRQTAEREQALFERKISSERDLRDAEAAATRARADKEAAEVRLHTLGVSDAQLARISASDHLASGIAVTSPIDGVVVDRLATLGETLDAGAPLFVVMDLRTVWIIADVYERDLAQVAIGNSVAVRVEAWRDRVFTGTIASIGATVDRRSRTVKVRVVMTNADGALKPGMFAAATLAGAIGEPRDGLYVPTAAVQRDGAGAIVFVPAGDGEYQLRPVEVGASREGWIEITRGLAPGERVVTTGSFLLKSEARRDSFAGHED